MGTNTTVAVRLLHYSTSTFCSQLERHQGDAGLVWMGNVRGLFILSAGGTMTSTSRGCRCAVVKLLKVRLDFCCVLVRRTRLLSGSFLTETSWSIRTMTQDGLTSSPVDGSFAQFSPKLHAKLLHARNISALMHEAAHSHQFGRRNTDSGV